MAKRNQKTLILNQAISTNCSSLEMQHCLKIVSSLSCSRRPHLSTDTMVLQTPLAAKQACRVWAIARASAYHSGFLSAAPFTPCHVVFFFNCPGGSLPFTCLSADASGFIQLWASCPFYVHRCPLSITVRRGTNFLLPVRMLAGMNVF